MKKHNFNAGPCILPEVALQNTAKAVIDLDGIGMSVLTISHRSKEFEAIMDETKALWRELLHIPDNYHILFLGGGASLQFCMVPYNLLQKKAVYLETGVWAKKALQEAKIFGDATALASSADKNFTYIPKGFKIPTDVDYFHVTTNNTIYGTELKEDIDSPVTLVADMSSDIMSRPVDIKKYGLIYGGAQKNVGPAGVTFVIIREDILGKVDRKIPTMLDYRTHIKEDSMFNTPPCGAIFTMRETLKWVKSIGGVEKINELNKKKAQLLYDAIDSSKMFVGTVEKDSRSIMNICFVMKPEYKDKEDAFMDFAKKAGMVGIKGHRSVGGFRASTYNALPIESVQALVDCMREFEKQNA
ncbi:MAG: 3-phosphoserine/phosphohydroxythreonine transaminase [Bacteroidales bacterium]|jgi:phosphoserine aminotransferase|nr:3-phosphoserine/phosphohydroxythreonine transaminase [Bacteroidales bacterium]HNT41820.1 3-phosphoserine/phosphohydroxythreonine transaminase [Tenuifilaceae bacterium]MBP8643924.1 3-phosphoserine/phosphohydroxythreonine transaminase [Bacteroidales bacterium]NLI86624.1 3-phosphoserine/phosphohydroxythreonine transaminase [Bacteroidales bacterium]HOA10146.1 3-phosphoserine/phosphohydroxythreonine transaminase [Tenuifilaceae bacterium]